MRAATGFTLLAGLLLMGSVSHARPQQAQAGPRRDSVGFDLGFINTALRRSGREPLANRVVDTLPIARRLLRSEVPDCRLGTLANRFRLTTRPTHRALDDAMATAELLQAQIANRYSPDTPLKALWC